MLLLLCLDHGTSYVLVIMLLMRGYFLKCTYSIIKFSILFNIGHFVFCKSFLYNVVTMYSGLKVTIKITNEYSLYRTFTKVHLLCGAASIKMLPRERPGYRNMPFGFSVCR